MQAKRVVGITFALNVALCVAHFAVYFVSRSELVLAQGADSLMDLAVGVVLLVSVRVAAQPRDDNHPFGHQRAEPIGALVTSIFAFVLAIEVARSAAFSLSAPPAARVDLPVFAVLAAKCVVKIGLLLSLLRHRALAAGAPASQAVDATRLDTLNDVLTTASSLVGAGLVHAGWVRCDALLALPVALYLGKNGWELARESLRFLMGEAPAPEVLARLRVAAKVDGVLEVTKLRAHHVGATLHVEATVLIAAGSSAKQSHDVALDVQQSLERDPLVGEAFVHLDTGEGKDGT